MCVYTHTYSFSLSLSLMNVLQLHENLHQEFFPGIRKTNENTFYQRSNENTLDTNENTLDTNENTFYQRSRIRETNEGIPSCLAPQRAQSGLRTEFEITRTRSSPLPPRRVRIHSDASQVLLDRSTHTHTHT
jgi:hypothetical protein